MEQQGQSLRKETNWLTGLLVAGLFQVQISAAVATPPDAEFVTAKQSFLKEMKKKSTEARVAAVDRFAELARPETAEFLLKRGFSDPETPVRIATQRGLRKLAGDPDVGLFLIDELKKSLRKSSAGESNQIELLRALAPDEDESRQVEIQKILDDFLASAKSNYLVPITVIDDAATQGDAEALRSLLLLSKAKKFDEHFGYRRALVQAFSQIREPEAVDFLIDLLPKTEGLIQHDVIQYLTRLTSQKFRDNDREWKIWWTENRSKFDFPPLGDVLPEVIQGEQVRTYYGIPICAKRIVFVLDTSGSMRGQPIERAKQALVKVIESLPEQVAFGLIFFDNSPTVWQPRLVPATIEAKQLATRTISERGVKLGTASRAALNAAFELQPEAIYFLSDGEPTDGTPDQIVNEARQFNRTRRVSIHTIGVVTQNHGGVGLTLFMQPLAQQNFGQFRLVE